ncbi:MAG: hypothetical protein KIT14_10155 [bacterium]|nr:hypothetical protein [bacterium]
MRPLLVAAALVLTLLAPASRAGAQAADADGIADAVDACPDTGTGALVGTDGCEVCGCDADAAGTEWPSRYHYFRCVVTAARAARDLGTVDRRTYRSLVRQARLSNCGSPDLARCCLFRRAGDTEGRCRMLPADRCDAEVMRADEATALEPGTCLPNPCVRGE